VRFDVLTLFPGIFDGFLEESILKRAQNEGLLTIHLHDIRDWATDKHRTVDDYPYGGGAGMVMKPEPIFAAVEAVQPLAEPPGKVVLLTPQGRVFNQRVAGELSEQPRVLLLCGRYEGVDERVREHLVDDEISVGDYVLGGGELAAMVVIETVARLIPGVLGSAESLRQESHSEGLLEYPQYTRPPEFRGWRVPDILLSGHHGEVEKWRQEQRLKRTRERRPDLFPPNDRPDPW
jgi:tRNA (guanine37-N1)-methyltransferase